MSEPFGGIPDPEPPFGESLTDEQKHGVSLVMLHELEQSLINNNNTPFLFKMAQQTADPEERYRLFKMVKYMSENTEPFSDLDASS